MRKRCVLSWALKDDKDEERQVFSEFQTTGDWYWKDRAPPIHTNIHQSVMRVRVITSLLTHLSLLNRSKKETHVVADRHGLINKPDSSHQPIGQPARLKSSTSRQTTVATTATFFYPVVHAFDGTLKSNNWLSIWSNRSVSINQSRNQSTKQTACRCNLLRSTL